MAGISLTNLELYLFHQHNVWDRESLGAWTPAIKAQRPKEQKMTIIWQVASCVHVIN